MNWNITTNEAIKLQKELREKVTLTPLDYMPDYVGGSDISYNKNSDTVYAAIVVLRYPEMIEVERKVIISKASFPYVPGLLSFRELPPLSEAWDQLEIKPNVLIMDGKEHKEGAH